MAESGIASVGDLLRRLPRRYVDRSQVTPLAEIERLVGQECTVAGVVSRVRVERGRRGRLRALIEDGSGALELLWFQGIPYLRNQITQGKRLLATGKIGKYRTLQMVHPQIEALADGQATTAEPFLPQYRVSVAMKEAGIGQKTLRAAAAWCLANARVPETLPELIVRRHGFAPLRECLEALHRPAGLDSLDRSRERLRYEELYTIALTLRLNRRQFAMPGRAMRAGEIAERFVKALPFTLTEGQRQAIEVLRADAASDRRMHRLLQGDVGCGKTVVAFAACLPALASGLQVAWLAPTEVLARQTFERARVWLEPLGFAAEILTAATAQSGKRAIREGLRNGDVRFVVGTHALLEETVVFGRLGMVVIDEQQRFGVAQRAELLAKGPQADFLLMTATPIPQTLAQAIYGDLDVVTIRGLPPGRIPVETRLVPETKRRDMERFIAERAAAGDAQAYYVVPRIEPGEDEEGELRDLESACAELCRGPFKGIPAAVVHGQMAAADKDDAVRSFSSSRTKLLLATSVVEVGLDAPGASIMVIENAECFGLSQLHQLRGRVGRAGQKAWCFLLSAASERDPGVKSRLEEFARMHDGFAIADLDLRLRGPGQAAGLRQSGWDDPSMAAILEDVGAFRAVQEEIESLAAA